MNDNKKTFGSLYHYTSIEKLCHILNGIDCDGEDKPYKLKFRASHILYMNDPTEFIYMAKVVREVITEIINDPLVKEDKSFCNHLKFVDDDILSPFLKDDNGYYVFSLSSHPDDLNQWRSYGGNGKGASLCFNKEKLSKLFDLTSCEYLEEKSLKEKLIDEMANSKDMNEITLKVLRMFFNSSSFKHPAYQAEKEYRIVKKTYSDIKFYERNGLIIPYIEIDIPLDCLEEIKIGPCLNKELSLNSIQMMLKAKTENEKDILDKIKVNASDIPYTP